MLFPVAFLLGPPQTAGEGAREGGSGAGDHQQHRQNKISNVLDTQKERDSSPLLCCQEARGCQSRASPAGPVASQAVPTLHESRLESSYGPKQCVCSAERRSWGNSLAQNNSYCNTLKRQISPLLFQQIQEVSSICRHALE